MKGDRVTEVSTWSFYNLIFPLLPIIGGIFVVLMQGQGFNLAELLGGTELYFLSLTAWISTKNDFDHADIRVDGRPVFGIYQRFGFVAILFCLGMMFWAVYIHEHVQQLRMVNSYIHLGGVIVAIFTSSICLVIQWFLASVPESPKPSASKRVARGRP